MQPADSVDRPVSRARAAVFALLWICVLAGVGVWVHDRLRLSGDLRLFLPSPRTEDQRILFDSLGAGGASRVLLVALSGSSPERLAATSIRLRESLSTDPSIGRALNGPPQLADGIPATLLPYRYLLSPAMDTRTFDTAFLRNQLEARLADLASPGAALVETLIARDPTLETLALADAWQPSSQPAMAHDVWFTRDGKRALLLVETVSGGFDPAAQQVALKAIEAAFARARPDDTVAIEISGPAAFGARIQAHTRAEATRLGVLSSVLMLLLLGWAYRSLSLPLIGALPLASAALAGLGMVAIAFDSVHGITLAFGFTLIGVVQDYPVHLFSHLRAGTGARLQAIALWPTLATGVVSTCLAYLSFFAAGVEGLQQLAVFTISGLLVAAATTRWLLPRLLLDRTLDVGELRWLKGLWQKLRSLPRFRMPAYAMFLIVLALLPFSSREWWDDDLSRLTPVPAHLLQRDRELRNELGAIDIRYALVIDAQDVEAVLRSSEVLEPQLRKLANSGAIAGFELPTRYLPSAATQRARQARLPDRATLAVALDDALVGLPFRAEVFAPFLQDVEKARMAKPLELADVSGTLLAARLSAQLRQREEGASSLVALTGVSDSRALEALARRAGGHVHLLDLKRTSESLAAEYRGRVLTALGGALVLLVVAVWIALRNPRRVLRVMAPVMLSLLFTVATLHAVGVAFNLFHLIAMILGAGLGLDYALFFEHGAKEGDSAVARRTLHAVVVCALSTLAVFGLLATSEIPVLRAIGITVTIAVAFNFLLAAMIASAEQSGPNRPRGASSAVHA